MQTTKPNFEGKSMNSSSREMSNYINIKEYHEAEATHPFYKEMVDEMLNQIKNISSKKETRVVEFGAGTGLFTKELLEINNLKVDAVEIDEVCYSYLQNNLGNKGANLILGDAITYSGDYFYDVVVSCFAHDHIHFDKRFDYAKNVARNLAPGGFYIVGHEIIPHFSNEEERIKALRSFQGYIIWKAIQDGCEKVAGLELESLKSAIAGIGDCKRHMKMFEEEMQAAGLKEIFRKKIGPLDREDVGGVYVFVYKNDKLKQIWEILG